MKPQQAATTTKSAPRRQVSVALLHHVSDAQLADQFAALLTAAGVAVVPWDSPEPDGMVVFLSAVGLAQPAWLDWTGASVRLIPVRVGDINAALVPERLRELNWIDWQPDNTRVTFGYVLAGLLSEPGRRDLSRQLSHEADAWVRSGRSDALLMTDYRRARRMVDVLRDLDADRLAAPSDTMRQFVLRSVKVLRPRYRRRRGRLMAGVVLTVVALVTAAVLVPAIRLGSYNNQESIVTTGDHYELVDLPEWSAANAAALLADGTPAEQALARLTLDQALNQPWEIGAPQLINPPYTSAPFRHGTQAVITISNGGSSVFAVLNVITQQVLWSVQIPGGDYYLSVSPDGGTALGVGASGAVVVNLATHAWRRIATGTNFADGKLGSDGVAVVRLADVHLAELNIASGLVTEVGAYPSIIGLAAMTPGHPAAALVVNGAGRIELIELPSRQVIATIPGNSSADFGTIAPDHRHAVIEGGDGQFWTFGAGQSAAPTGVAVPQLPGGLTWSSGDRLLVYSEDQRGQVYYLPRAEFLGTICREDPRLYDVAPDYRSDVVACEGAGSTTFWRLPPGPLANRAARESTSLSMTGSGVTVISRGDQIQLNAPGTKTGWVQPLASTISAVDIAQHGTRVVVGDMVGEVAVIDLSPGDASLVTVWVSPDYSPITAVGWSHGPVATTRSGQTWQVPECTNCATDAGLISTFRSRITGCFTARQLAFISSGVWSALGIRECSSALGGR